MPMVIMEPHPQGLSSAPLIGIGYLHPLFARMPWLVEFAGARIRMASLLLRLVAAAYRDHQLSPALRPASIIFWQSSGVLAMGFP